MGIKRCWNVATGVALLLGGVATVAGGARAEDTIKIGWIGRCRPPGGYAEGVLMKQGARRP
jgi:hypothetical protein